MNENQISLMSFIRLIADPFATTQGFIEYIQAWLFTRRAKALLPILPVILLFGGLLLLMVRGALLDPGKLLERYAQQVELEANDANSMKGNAAAAQLFKDEPVSEDMQMLLRRVLKIEKSNVRANYLVAVQMAKQGRLGQARQMLRSIAPKSARGFAPAYAWLAADRMLRKGISSREEKLELLHDLQMSTAWEGTGPLMHSALSDLLESEGKIGEAITVLTNAAKVTPELYVKLAGVAAKYGRRQPQEHAVEEAKKMFEQKSQNGVLSAMDYAAFANVYIIEQNLDQALQIASDGLVKNPENPTLKRVISESYRLKYLKTFKGSKDNTEVNLGLLDAALKADPTNPTIAQEVARLTALGKEASPELEESLRQQLANGRATAMTHLLLANGLLKDKKLTEAIPHLELAHRQAPNSPVILNNLALSIARTQPENLPRAAELIDRALKIVQDAELLDSQGEIRMLQGDKVGAITSFEGAIGIDGSRIGSRELLAAAYEEAGLPDMAKVQRGAVEKLRSEKAKDASATGNQSTNEVIPE